MEVKTIYSYLGDLFVSLLSHKSIIQKYKIFNNFIFNTIIITYNIKLFYNLTKNNKNIFNY
jgi:hypothetical protein